MGKPTEELRARFDERDINWWTDKYYRDTNTCWRVGDFEWRASEKEEGKLLIGCTCVKYLTPEQAIAATVGVTEDETDARDLTEAIRDDDGVRYSMDEVMEIMGKDVAATVGEESEMHICKRCGVAYELNIIDKGFGKHRFCPNCGYREMYQ